MALEVSVGLLGYFLEDEDGAGFYTEELAAVNDALREAGLPAFAEPAADEVEPVELTLGPVSGLQALRRVAAHVRAGGGVPPPSEEPAEEDPVLAAYYETRGDDGDPRAPRFDHLVLHADASGCYVPLAFDRVLGEVGSSHRLREELEPLAEMLGLPAEVEPESGELWDAYDTPGEGWKRHGVEAFVCARLLHAARASVEHKALLAFG